MLAMRDQAVDETLEFLHTNLTGFIRFDGDRIPVKVIVAPDGYLVLPVMEAMLHAADVVLELPDDGTESLQLMVTLQRMDPDGAFAGLCDRWSAYHGEPEDVRWARVEIDASRFRDWFVDGEALLQPNPLAREELSLLKLLNAQPRTFLQSFCATNKVPCENPIAVGLTDCGVDVRRAHDVVRLEFPMRLEQAAQVRSFIQGDAAPFTPGMA